MSEKLVRGNLNTLSPYTRFMLENIGYCFKNVKNDTDVCKWEIWVTFENDFHNLNLIYLGRHSLYKRIKREDKNEL